MIKRIFDFTLGGALLVLFAPLVVALVLVVRLDTPGRAIHWSRRVGRYGKPFWMPKFRTMRSDTPQVATHLLEEPDKWITRTGRWLRRTSLDELPQLLSIVAGQMSFVGPRPALTNQHDLNELRAEQLIDHLRPGLTGWAQINGRDELSIEDKVAYDRQYLSAVSLRHDARIMVLTALRVVRADGVREGNQSVPSSRAA